MSISSSIIFAFWNSSVFQLFTKHEKQNHPSLNISLSVFGIPQNLVASFFGEKCLELHLVSNSNERSPKMRKVWETTIPEITEDELL